MKLVENTEKQAKVVKLTDRSNFLEIYSERSGLNMLRSKHA